MVVRTFSRGTGAVDETGQSLEFECAALYLPARPITFNWLQAGRSALLSVVFAIFACSKTVVFATLENPEMFPWSHSVSQPSSVHLSALHCQEQSAPEQSGLSNNRRVPKLTPIYDSNDIIAAVPTASAARGAGTNTGFCSDTQTLIQSQNHTLVNGSETAGGQDVLSSKSRSTFLTDSHINWREILVLAARIVMLSTYVLISVVVKLAKFLLALAISNVSTVPLVCYLVIILTWIGASYLRTYLIQGRHSTFWIAFNLVRLDLRNRFC